MRAVWTWILLGLALVGAGRGWAGPAGGKPPEFAKIAGHDYVSMRDWAAANELQPRWIKPEKSLAVANPRIRLVFEMDSRDVDLNGVKVRLSFPVLLRDGVVWLSRLDVQAALRPVLHPPRQSGPRRPLRIVLDPGHGGKDPGFEDGERQEKRYTLLLAEQLTLELRAAGCEVFLTRTNDQYVQRELRADLARQRKADLFISLHWNSVGSVRNDAQGAQVYCMTPAGAASSNADGGETVGEAYAGNRCDDRNMLLAYSIQRALTKLPGLEDRGVLRARFEVLRLAEMPAVLIEGGFMSHPAESKRIYDPSYRRQLARAITTGVLAYRKQLSRAN